MADGKPPNKRRKPAGPSRQPGPSKSGQSRDKSPNSKSGSTRPANKSRSRTSGILETHVIDHGTPSLRIPSPSSSKSDERAGDSNSALQGEATRSIKADPKAQQRIAKQKRRAEQARKSAAQKLALQQKKQLQKQQKEENLKKQRALRAQTEAQARQQQDLLDEARRQAEAEAREQERLRDEARKQAQVEALENERQIEEVRKYAEAEKREQERLRDEARKQTEAEARRAEQARLDEKRAADAIALEQQRLREEARKQAEAEKREQERLRDEARKQAETETRERERIQRDIEKQERQRELAQQKAERLAHKRQLEQEKALDAERRREEKRRAYLEKKALKEHESQRRNLAKEQRLEEKRLRAEARRQAQVEAREQNRLRDEDRRQVENELSEQRFAERELHEQEHQRELAQQKAERLAHKRQLEQEKALDAERRREEKRRAYLGKKALKEQQAKARRDAETERRRQEQERKQIELALSAEESRRELQIKQANQKRIRDEKAARQEAKRGEQRTRHLEKRSMSRRLSSPPSNVPRGTFGSGNLSEPTPPRDQVRGAQPIAPLNTSTESIDPVIRQQERVPLQDFFAGIEIEDSKSSTQVGLQLAERPVQVAPAIPVSPTPKSTLRSTHPAMWEAIATVAQFTFILGLLIPMFLVNELWLTSVKTTSRQKILLVQFQQQIDSFNKYVARTHPANPAPGLLPATSPQAPSDGSPVAEITIPSIDASFIIVQGISRADLASGPGHVPGTPLPGEAGNVVIVGHRTIYAHPFYYLDQLGVGDQVLIKTSKADLVYSVAHTGVVTSNYSQLLTPSTGDLLTLVTSNPRYLSSSRYEVTAKLVSVDKNPVVPTTGIHLTNPSNLSPESLSLGGQLGSPGPLVLSLLCMLATNQVIRYFARRDRPVRIYLYSLPLVILIGVFIVASANSLLPGTL